MRSKEDILMIILVLILVSSIFFNNQIPTGFSVLEQELNFEDLPNQINISKNSQFTLEITKPDYKFSDNTPFFNITEEGLIDFTMGEENFRAVIIVLDQYVDLQTKVIRFNSK